MGLFERFLTVWVALGIGAGVFLGLWLPGVFEAVAALEYAQVNLVVAVFIWVMIYPMMIHHRLPIERLRLPRHTGG